MLLERAREDDALVVHVQNEGTAGDPDEPGTPGWELVFAPNAEELVVGKDEPDTFASNPILAEDLKGRHVSRLVIAGMQSNYCVAATSRAGLDRFRRDPRLGCARHLRRGQAGRRHLVRDRGGPGPGGRPSGCGVCGQVRLTVAP